MRITHEAPYDPRVNPPADARGRVQCDGLVRVARSHLGASGQRMANTDKRDHSRLSGPSLEASTTLQLSGSSRGRTRTCDPLINSQLLYQLSYSGRAKRIKPPTYRGKLPQNALPIPRNGFCDSALVLL